MTAETDLLPLPEWCQGCGESLPRDMQAYARANVAHATAAKDAVIQALRAEVERLTFEMSCLRQQYDERTAYMIVHRGAALACSDSVRAAYSDEHRRAERLAEEVEALRAEVERLTGCLATANANHEQFERQWYLEHDHAERLAEALRELVAVFSESGMYDEEVFDKARAALKQETPR